MTHRKLGGAAIAALCAALTAPGRGAAQSWTASPTALAVRDALFEAAGPAMGSLGGQGEGRPRSIVLAKRVSAPAAVEMNVEKALRELGPSAKDPHFAEASRRALRKHFAEAMEAEGTAAYWYLYGTAAAFPDVMIVAFPGGAAANPGRGHVIRASADEERAMFSPAALSWRGHPLRVLVEGTGADLLVLDDPTGAAARLTRSAKPFVGSVLHVDVTSKELPQARDQYRALLRLRSVGLGEVDVLDLLPSSLDDVRGWGYRSDLAAEELRGAKRLRALLSRPALKHAELRGPESEAAVEFANAAAARRRRVLLVADVSGERSSIHLPGQGMLAEADVRRMEPGASFIGLFVGSGTALHRFDSLSLLGTIRPHPSASFVSVALDRSGLSSRRGLVEIEVGSNNVLRAIRDATSGERREGSGTGAKGGLAARVYAFDARSLADALRSGPVETDDSEGAGQ